jgi:hypothetical protein
MEFKKGGGGEKVIIKINKFSNFKCNLTKGKKDA